MASTEWLADVVNELDRQHRKFGVQTHPDGTNADYAAVADMYRHRCDIATASGLLTWNDILTEEFYEALAETDPAKLREELIQVAAVALQWVTSLDNRGK